jgi:ribose 5-phosphate isomerase B
MKKARIAIGSDHAGFEYKNFIKANLISEGFAVHDYGTHSEDSVDYPDYVHPLSSAIEKKVEDVGILICGSANGVCITANKHQGIRAAIVWQDDLSALARLHNDANVICLPARFITKEQALTFVKTFLSTDFEGGRHSQRVNKIAL